jgi:alginate O-acetyltransferase complex protein AlgI
LAFLAINALLFETPLYRHFIAPDSSAGVFERGLSDATAAAHDPGSDVLVLGDSRIYNGFDIATAERAAPNLHFINAGVPGTTPRCWAVFDRSLDPQARRFRAVVIPVDTYSDDDGAIGSLDAWDHYFDLHYIVYTATPRETVRIARSFPGIERRYQALFDLALRGPLLREDVQNFVVDPEARFAALAAQPAEAANSHLRTRTLAALRVDFAHDTLVEPPDFPASQIGELRRQVLAIARPSPAYAAYREAWLGTIVRRYQATGTPVIFVRIPTRPLHRELPPPPSGTIPGFAAHDGALLIPQGPYVALERPDLFADADHLNRTGALRFSRMLGADVARILQIPAAAAPPRSRTAVAPRAAPYALDARRGAQITIDGFGPDSSALGIGTPIRFQSYEFGVFFVLVVILYYAIPSVRVRRAVLLGASWYFYARWNAAYLAVLLGLTATDYAFGLGVERTSGVPRRAMLSAGITANVAFLGSVKYLDFFTGSFARLLGIPGDPWALHLIVPVGISFHTFQSISYLVDVSRGKTRAVRNFFDYALYLAFFPQLLAGPIVRAGTFFGELYARAAAVPERFTRGTYQIVLGLLKKSVIADRFAPAADAYFGSIATHPGAAAAWSGAFAFAMQIYFDFSGYSDIAIGCARVLGFDFPENFRRPYLAWSVTEFWRRWHMTLSSWLRDYLYIPFGGNRHGRLATYRNLMLTMLIGGLWHGANWTFVAWGAYHGAALAIERALGIGRSRESLPPRGLTRIARTLATFLIVLIGWVFFRAQSFHEAFTTLAAMLRAAPGPSLLDAPTLLLAALVFSIEIAVESNIVSTWRHAPLLRGAVTVGLLFGLELGSYPGTAAEFVYFRF